MLAAAVLAGAAAPVAGAPSIAGVHWYSGDSAMLDLSVPAGERGYNVEVIFDTGWCDGDPGTDPGDVRSVAATAKAHGLVNIVRVDYRQMQAVPTSSAAYGPWATGFIKCTQELSDLASLFVVGNEPNIEDGGRPEGDIRGDEYASAFNYLYSRKGEMPSGTQLLATFNSPFTPPGWMLDMSSRLTGVDGFALHTGGVRPGCRDPRQPCSYGGWPFDGAFRYYRDVIASIHSSWWSRPVYVTEFNTFTGDPGSEPDVNYPADWINQAFEEVRSYNATRGTKPAVKALCWFVDRPQSWPRFSLRNVGAARTDMGEEFKNPANRGAGGSCPNGPLGTPTDRWKLEIWSNKDLAGATVEQRYDAAGGGGFSFDWGSGRPTSCVGNDNFGVRFTRKAFFATGGTYTFTARTDDGVRLFVDGTPVVDDWRDMAPTTHTASVPLAAGWHDLRMDYYENAGGALASLGWTGGGTPPQNVARSAVAWAASSVYGAANGGDKAYDGIVSVASKWTSNGATADSWLALDLGRSYDVTRFVVKHAGSAGESKGYNTQAFRLESGTSLSGPWTTRATVANTAQDDASTVTLGGPVATRYVRLYVTDAGIDNYARIPELEVYGAPSGSPCQGSAPPDHWKGEYFGNQSLSGSPAMVRDDGTAGLAFDWGTGSPSSDCGIGADHFSARWIRTLPFAAGTYRFDTRTDDGVRLYVDDVLRIDRWIDRAAPPVPDSMDVTLGAGNHTLRLEYYENGGLASAELTWQAILNHPPTAVATANPTSGPAPLAVAFSGTGSSDPDGDPLTCTWTFGDGTSGSGATVNHSYSASGSYTATLTVEDTRGAKSSATVAITVGPPSTGNLVTNGSFDAGLNGWTTWTERGAMNVVVENGQLHEWSGNHNGGVYQQFQTGGAGATIEVEGFWASDPTVANGQWAEVLVINGPRLPVNGQDVKGDQGDVVLAYKNDTWRTPGGWSGPMAQTSPVARQRSFVASGPVATIILKSGNPGGATTGTRFDAIVVTRATAPPPPVNHPPTAVASASPTSGPAPLAVDFDGAGSSDPDGDPLAYAWSFGDGTQGSGVSVSHTYPAAGSYTAALTVNDGRGGTHSAEVVIVVDPASGNRPPVAVISASPESGTVPFTVTLDGLGSSDPDGDPLTYTWQFADGVQGTGPTMQRHFPLGDWRRGEGPEKHAGGYLVTLTVTDDGGATGSASLRIRAIPPQGCPESLDFDAIRAELDTQGRELVFSKIGFHTGGGGTLTGLGVWERCLDLNGVPFTVKQVPSNANASAAEAAEMGKRSGVPHTAIFRRCCEENGINYELPACAVASAGSGWSLCTMENARQEAQDHWRRHLQAFPPDLEASKHLVWVETINEPWKGSSTRNNAEWLARFSYYTALEALAAGYNYAAFGWSTGEPEYGPPPDPGRDPSYQWDGPEMQRFLRLAAQYPDRIAISLHEYDLHDPTLKAGYPDMAGRFTKLFERCDANGIPRPTVLITEFGWPGVPAVGEIMSADNVPWAAGMYARHPQVKGVALWDDGGVVDAIVAFTTYSLRSYFAIPRSSPSTRVRRPVAFVTAERHEEP